MARVAGWRAIGGFFKDLLGGAEIAQEPTKVAGIAEPTPEQVQELAHQVSRTPDAQILEEERRLGPILSRILADVGAKATVGVTTQSLAEALVAGSLATRTLPAMLGYRGFPTVAAISVNDEIVHGFPTSRRLAPGDLIKIEYGIASGRGFASQSWTFVAGQPSRVDQRLLKTGVRALRAALATLKHQVRLGDIGAAIEGTANAAELTVVRDFVGYGMGKKRIQEPQVKGYGKAGFGQRIAAGTVLNLHVIIKRGTPELRIADNDWNALAADGERGAIFTAMAEITTDGHRLLTPLLDE